MASTRITCGEATFRFISISYTLNVGRNKKASGLTTMRTNDRKRALIWNETMGANSPQKERNSLMINKLMVMYHGQRDSCRSLVNLAKLQKQIEWMKWILYLCRYWAPPTVCCLCTYMQFQTFHIHTGFFFLIRVGIVEVTRAWCHNLRFKQLDYPVHGGSVFWTWRNTLNGNGEQGIKAFSLHSFTLRINNVSLPILCDQKI